MEFNKLHENFFQGSIELSVLDAFTGLNKLQSCNYGIRWEILLESRNLYKKIISYTEKNNNIYFLPAVPRDELCSIPHLQIMVCV